MDNRPTQKTIQVEVETDTFVQHETIVGPSPGINRVSQYRFTASY